MKGCEFLMKKRGFRINPVNLYNRHQVQNWLDENANQGLIPIWIGSFSSVFITEKEMQLHLQLGIGWKDKPELLEHYHKAGWDYVCSVRLFFLFIAPKETPLPCENKKLQDKSVEWHRKRTHSQHRAMWIMPLWFLFLLLLFLLPNEYDVQPDRWAKIPLLLLDLSNPAFLCLLAVMILLHIQVFQEKSHRNQREKSCNLPVHSSSLNNKKTFITNKIFIILCGLMVIFGGIDYLWTRPIPLETFSQPYIKLSEIEKVSISSWEELYESTPFHEDDNQGEYSYSLIAPKAYIVNQRGFETIETHKGEEYHSASSLEMAYFSTILSMFTRSIAEAQMDQFRTVNTKWNYHEITVPELDFAILAETEEGVSQMIALGCGKNTVIFYYSGLEQLENHIPQLATLIVE